jgi:hypothetical protein
MSQPGYLKYPENCSLFESHPPQGLSEARRGKKVSAFFSHLNRRGGAPSGAAAFIAMVKKDLL